MPELPSNDVSQTLLWPWAMAGESGRQPESVWREGGHSANCPRRP